MPDCVNRGQNLWYTIPDGYRGFHIVVWGYPKGQPFDFKSGKHTVKDTKHTQTVEGIYHLNLMKADYTLIKDNAPSVFCMKANYENGQEILWGNPQKGRVTIHDIYTTTETREVLSAYPQTRKMLGDNIPSELRFTVYFIGDIDDYNKMPSPPQILK